MPKFTITDYNDSNCPLFKSMKECNIFGVSFQALYNACNGNICFECNYKCKELNNKDGEFQPVKIIRCVKTNAEIAKILHCSKRQVGKMRKNKTLPKEYL